MDDFTAVYRLANVLLGIIALLTTKAWITEVQPVMNQKGKQAMFIVLGWALLAIAGSLEQLFQQTEFGFRMIGTSAMLIVTIQTGRIKGSTVGDGRIEPQR